MKMGAAGLAVALFAAGGCSKARTDASLAANIKAAISSDAELKDASLDVTVEKGAATLRGTVPSDGAHLEAYKIVSQTPGIAKVSDQVTVQAPAEAIAATAPAAAEQPAAPATKSPAAEKNRKAGAARHSDTQAATDNRTKTTPAPEPAAPATTSAANATAAPTSGETNAPTAPATQDTSATLASAAPASPPAPPSPMPQDVEIASGTTITVRMIDSVDSSVNKVGEIFHASLDAPISVNGGVVISRGADVFLRLTQASKAGAMSGKSEIHLALVKIDYQGRSYSLVSSTYAASGPNRSKRTALAVGGGAVLGTLLGAIAGGGRGAAIGAAAGAAGGGIYSGSAKGKQVKIPAETKLDFQLEQPVTVTVMPRANGARDANASATPETPSN